MARWFFTFETLNPNDFDGMWETGIQEKHFRTLQHHGHSKSLARIVLVGNVLQGETKYLYRGWSRPDKEDCYVYAGYPDMDYKSHDITTPAPKNMAFLVFVLPDGTIDEWTWRPCREDSDQPEEIHGELIWTATTS